MTQITVIFNKGLSYQEGEVGSCGRPGCWWEERKGWGQEGVVEEMGYRWGRRWGYWREAGVIEAH